MSSRSSATAPSTARTPTAPASGRCSPGRRGNGNARLRGVEQGSSRGYTDRYPPHVHGQNLELTGVPAGIFVLVHHANPDGLLRERHYDNNAASVRIRLARTQGVPSVRVLRSCEGSERC